MKHCKRSKTCLLAIMRCRVPTQRQLDKARQEAVYELSPVVILSILYVCENKLHFGFEKMRKVADRVNNRYDDITQKYVSFEDLKDCLKDDGIEIPFSLDYQPCHTLDNARRIAEYTQKAFATAVFSSVLVDKFLFGAVKSQQAVKWLCDTFDKLKENRREISELQERYLNDYGIQVK